MSFFSFDTDAENESLDMTYYYKKSRAKRQTKKINIKQVTKLDIKLYDNSTRKFKCNATMNNRDVVDVVLDYDDIYVIMKKLDQQIPEIFRENCNE